ncbi:MAG: phosphoribosylformylglycinamidine cyclo-ligase [Actinomycetota bacterium]|nr:MAG: phosphoribosylformylglycinamidine cyclo-ligase [Actinomycetota bacterium]
MDNSTRKPLTYASAGVDIKAGETAVSKIRSKVQSTFSKQVVSDIGGFAGMFAPDLAGYQEPVFVSSTDGVGTKAMVAVWANAYDSIGIDLVAMCVDDLVCTGAMPLFMLDYISIGKLDPDQIEKLVDGIVAGCIMAGASLIGGEMAEHPGAMEQGGFDLAGFAVGVVDRSKVWGTHRVRKGDKLIGLASPNLRSNGFSLARASLFGSSSVEEIKKRGSEPAWPGSAKPLFEVLLEPSVIYSDAISSLPDKNLVHSCAHITGGGIPGNLPRSLPDGHSANIQLDSFDVPRIFKEIQGAGRISDEEMFRVFNMGVGMILAIEPSGEAAVRSHLDNCAIQTYLLGTVEEDGGGVNFV